jgi:DNA-binding transcriptional LysR family regulator
VGGKDVNTEAFKKVLKTKDAEQIEAWLKNEKWYGTTGDMEHLFQYWTLNFGHKPNFRPNYIVPNLNSIIRCLKGGTGLAVVPDFLCKNEIESGEIKLIWEGKKKLENILYFGCRKKTSYQTEIEHIKGLFRKVMSK